MSHLGLRYTHCYALLLYAVSKSSVKMKLRIYKKFMAKDSRYNKDAADFAVMFIESLCHTKGTWAGQPFELIDWQEQIIRDLFGIVLCILYALHHLLYCLQCLHMPIIREFHAFTV